jgi:hypothetical protein
MTRNSINVVQQLFARDFFLWGYLKSKVYAHCPHNIAELKQRIRDEINSIPVEMLGRVMGNMHSSLEECLLKNGGHLTDIMFKK